jgi:hypothetical protein
VNGVREKGRRGRGGCRNGREEGKKKERKKERKKEKTPILSIAPERRKNSSKTHTRKNRKKLVLSFSFSSSSSSLRIVSQRTTNAAPADPLVRQRLAPLQARLGPQAGLAERQGERQQPRQQCCPASPLFPLAIEGPVRPQRRALFRGALPLQHAAELAGGRPGEEWRRGPSR